MRRIVALVSGLAVTSLVTIVPGAGATAVHERGVTAKVQTKIVGTWTGTIEGDGAPEHLTVTVNKKERTGTWSVSSSCYGTLALKNISEGFHHFNRIAATGATCSGGSGGGVDCLKRDGSLLYDEYQPTGSPGWSSGLLTRTH